MAGKGDGNCWKIFCISQNTPPKLCISPRGTVWEREGGREIEKERERERKRERRAYLRILLENDRDREAERERERGRGRES